MSGAWVSHNWKLYRLFYCGLTLWHMLCNTSMTAPSHDPPLLLFSFALGVLIYTDSTSVESLLLALLWPTTVGKVSLFLAAYSWISRAQGRDKNQSCSAQNWKKKKNRKSFCTILYKFNFFLATIPFGACLRESDPGNRISCYSYGRYIWCNRGSMTGLYYSK